MELMALGTTTVPVPNKFEEELEEGSGINASDSPDVVKFARNQFAIADKQRDSRQKELESMTMLFRQLREESFDEWQFISPLLQLTIEKYISSDWIPQIEFDPEQTSGDNADIFKARNATRAHDFVLGKGGFRKAMMDGGVDFFARGQIYIMKGWETRVDMDENGKPFEMPTVIKFKNVPWNQVWEVKDGSTQFWVKDHTADELREEFGDDIFKGNKVKWGSPFTSDQEEDYITLNAQEQGDSTPKKVRVAWVFNATKKIYAVIMGGSSHVEVNLTGKKYPWIKPDGKGYSPLSRFNVTAPLYGYYPTSPIDKLVRLYRSYTTMMNATLKRAQDAARPDRIVVSENPADARLNWEQSIADKANGVDMPVFLKDKGQGFSTDFKTADWGVNNNNNQIWREQFIDEAMMAVGINFRALSDSAPTAEQERTRDKRELRTFQEILIYNEESFKEFALTNIYMLGSATSDELTEFIELEDEFTEEFDSRPTFTGTLEDAIGDISDFKLNVKVSINNSSRSQRSIELAQQEEAVAKMIPGTVAYAKASKEVAEKTFPKMQFSLEDWQLPETPPNTGSAPNIRPAGGTPNAQQTEAAIA